MFFHFDTGSGRNYYSPLMSAIWFAALTGDELLKTRSLSDELAVASLARVKSVAMEDSGPFAVRFAFEPQQGLVLVTGTVSGHINVRCERCLESLCIEVDSELRVALDDGGSNEGLPAGYETISMTDGQVRLAELVEDEVLLAVPLVARHEDGQCGALAKQLEQLRASPASKATTSPFAGLDKLMRNKRD